MQHDTFTEKISLWLDDELNPAEITELQNHLAECSTCQHFHQAILQVHNLFHTASAYMVEPQPGLSSRVRSRLAHQPTQKSWHMWLGLSGLLLGSLFFFAVGAVLGWLSLINASGTLFEMGTIYYGLGILGTTVNDIRAIVNLLGMGVKVALLIMSQPLFWIYVLIAIGLTALWVRVMQSVYRRTPIGIQIFI
jgi:predicted anti-sigma-YlaC factor YlaD